MASLLQRAYAAVDAKDWVLAESIWAEARRLDPACAEAWCHNVTSLRELGRAAEADAVMNEARTRFPTDRGVLIFAGYQATIQKDAQEAVKRWGEVLRLYPDTAEAVLHHNHALSDLENIALDAEQGSVPVTFAQPPKAVGVSDRDLMLRFQNLGYDCEFGVIQRRFAAEPLGLFRWASMPADTLAQIIRDDLLPFETAEDAELDVLPDVSDYHLVIRNLAFIMHTHILKTEPPDRLLVSLKRRLRRLREKMVEDLAEGGTIFVHKARTRLECVPEMFDLHAALSLRARCPLLWVMVGVGEQIGRVERVEEGLAIGYLDQYWDNPEYISQDVWLSVCRNAAALFDADALLASVTKSTLNTPNIQSELQATG
jgi:tetratricopeptide (TPR) repeat protein